MAALIEQAVVAQRQLEIRRHQPAIERAGTAQRGVTTRQGLQQDADQIDRVLVHFIETGLGGVVTELARTTDDLVADHRRQRPAVVAGKGADVRRGVVALQHGGNAQQLLRREHADTIDAGRRWRCNALIGSRSRGRAAAQDTLAPGTQLLMHGFAVAQRPVAVGQHAAGSRLSAGCGLAAAVIPGRIGRLAALRSMPL